MVKRMLIDAVHPEETRVVIADEKQIYDFDFITAAKKQLKGNIYLAKITRVEPSLQAAFVEYGGGKQGFLPFAEVHPDYYQIPMSDRKRLMEEAQSEEESDEPARPETPEAPANEQAQEDAAAPAAETELPQATDDAERPAYLMQGAIDVSTSEDLPHPDDNMPISQAPAEAAHDAPPAETGGESAEASAASEGVETLPNEEEEYRPKKKTYSRRYKIQEVIRRGQIVLVQVIKEERGNKGVSLTTFLSLAGRYCVLMPNSPKDGGISRKIASADDRKRLKSISTELRLATGMSVIIRTAGMDRTRAEIKRDYDYLVKVWNQIREDTLSSNAPALIYEESDIIKRAIRDQYSGDIDEVVIEGDEAYKSARDFMKLLMSSHTARIKHYKEATPLFYAYNIEEQLLSMHDPVVKLRSGGYIVINPTEALISIDVNSGRATGERNIEETATKTNLEAAAEVARQLRLRDLAGLIVIDFIDMLESRNRRAVEKALKDSLKADRAKIQLGRISPFGLLEMSRQRLRPSISETNMMQCPHCVGRGYIRSNESMSIQVIRAVEKEASAGVWSSLRVIVPQPVALHLLNFKRDFLRVIEQRHNVAVQVLIGPELTSSEFNLEKMRRSQSERGERDRDRDRDRNRDRDRRPERSQRPPQEAPPSDDEPMNDNIAPETEISEETREGQPTQDNQDRKRGRRRRGGRGRGRDRREGPPPAAEGGMDAERAPDEMAAAAPEESPGAAQDQERPRPHRDRGDRPRGRGRRPWREGGDRQERPRPDDRNLTEQAAPPSDGNALPAFATEERLPPPPPPREPVAAAAPPPSTPRDPNAPSKKGWWQKIIELDE